MGSAPRPRRSSPFMKSRSVGRALGFQRRCSLPHPWLLLLWRRLRRCRPPPTALSGRRRSERRGQPTACRWLMPRPRSPLPPQPWPLQRLRCLRQPVRPLVPQALLRCDRPRAPAPAASGVEAEAVAVAVWTAGSARLWLLLLRRRAGQGLLLGPAALQRRLLRHAQTLPQPSTTRPPTWLRRLRSCRLGTAWLA